MVPMKSATKAIAGLAVDLERRAHLLDRALVHHHDAVGHGQRLLLVVRDHDRGDAEPALQRADLLAQVHAHLGIERRERLVEQEQPGRRWPARGPARRAAAGRRRAATDTCDPGRQARRARAARHAALDLGARPAPVLEPVGDVLRDREVREQRVGLEHDAEVARRRRQRRDVAPACSMRPVVWSRGRRWRAAAWSCRSPRARGSRRTRRSKTSSETSSSAVKAPKRLVRCVDAQSRRPARQRALGAGAIGRAPSGSIPSGRAAGAAHAP